MKKKVNLPAIKVVGGIRKDLLYLLRIDNPLMSCRLWNNLSDPRIDPKADNLGFSSDTLRIKWIITPCAGVIEIESIRSLMTEKMDNNIDQEPKECLEVDVPNVIDLDDDEDILYSESEIDLLTAVSEEKDLSLSQSLDAVKSIYCKRNEKCEQLHYFVGVGTHTVEGKEYNGIHVFEAYKYSLGPQKKDSVINQILPFKRLLKSLV